MSSEPKEVAALFPALLQDAYTAMEVRARIRALADGSMRARFGGTHETDAHEATQDAWDARALAGVHDSDAVLAALSARVDALPVLTLYLPVQLGAGGIARLGSWCRAHVEGNVLIDLRVDAAAAGGCILAWQDHLHDFSFRAALAEKPDAVAQAIAARAPLAA